MTDSSARRSWIALGLAAAAVAGCGGDGGPAAPSTPPQVPPSIVAGAGGAALDGYLQGLADAGRFTGSVLVARRGTVMLEKGYGLADQQQRIPDAPATRYRIGSITKQFTAAAILLLQDQRKLQVQDSICAYVSECPAAWQRVTLHHLLTHSSGIPDYIGFPDFGNLIGQPTTPDGLVARFKDKPLEFAPGALWKYSNSGYILLGIVIERVSGLSYAEFLRRSFFDPLQMADSGYDSNTPPLPQHATGYLSPGHKPVFIDMSEVYAAGALYSTVLDLLRWDETLLGERLLSREAITEMVTPHVPCPAGGCALGSDVGYGYGLFLADQGGERYVYHWGRIDGFRTSNGFYPRAGIEIVLLSNLETTDVFGVSTELGTRALVLR